MIKSIGAVVGGYLGMVAVVMVSDVTLAKAVPEAFDPEEHTIAQPWFTVSLALAFGAAVTGGWLCVRLAPRAGMAHAMGLAGLLMVMWIVTALLLPADMASPYLPILQPLGVVGVLVGGGLGTFLASRRPAPA